MKKLLLDTNIVLDLLARREPFYESAAHIISFGDKGKLKLFVSALTIANTNYVLGKFKGADEAREIIRRFLMLTKVLSLSEKTISLALNDIAFKDFEDGLQYYTAVENNLDTIITRDLKDFKTSEIPVMTASEYLSSTST
ncbi:MAG: PIN domain-containing protein [Imperialibacter sp.]